MTYLSSQCLRRFRSVSHESMRFSRKLIREEHAQLLFNFTFPFAFPYLSSSCTFTTLALSSSTSAASSPSSGGLATSPERRRFYKNVSIEPFCAPADYRNIAATSSSSSSSSSLSSANKALSSSSSSNIGKLAAVKEGFIVKLDGRQLRTPERTLLVLPTESLAIGVAGEWDAQFPTIKPSIMPLTILSNTATDIERNRTRDVRIDDMLRFLTTDTVCVRTPEPEGFVAFQKEHWDPIVQWFQNRFTVKLDITDTLFSNTTPETLNILYKYLNEMNEWKFTAIESATLSAKSFVIACALADGAITAEQACFAAFLEEEWQIKRWGRVEWGHEMRHSDARMTLAASALFARLAVVEKKSIPLP